MKILVAYYSQTGNTETIAKAISEEAAKSNEAELKKIEEVDAGSLGDYDMVFVGAPIHAGGLSAKAKEFLDALPDSPGFKLAGFVTHASDAYSRENYEKGIKAFDEIGSQKSIACLGCYDCQGRLAEAIRPMVQKARKVSDDEWAKIMEETDKHPSAEDKQKAMEFARETLSKT